MKRQDGDPGRDFVKNAHSTPNDCLLLITPLTLTHTSTPSAHSTRARHSSIQPHSLPLPTPHTHPPTRAQTHRTSATNTRRARTHTTTTTLAPRPANTPLHVFGQPSGFAKRRACLANTSLLTDLVNKSAMFSFVPIHWKRTNPCLAHHLA